MRHTFAPVLVATAGLALALAGCVADQTTSAAQGTLGAPTTSSTPAPTGSTTPAPAPTGSTTPAPAPTRSVPASSTATPMPVAASPTPKPMPSTARVVVQPGEQAAFSDPSGRVLCVIGAASVRCDVTGAHWPVPQGTTHCETADRGVVLGRTAVGTCPSDTILQLLTQGRPESAWATRQTATWVTAVSTRTRVAALRPGVAILANDLSCSTGTGVVRCANVASEHGFAVSLSGLRLS